MQVCQIPSIGVPNMKHLLELMKTESVKYVSDAKLSKDRIEDLFMKNGYRNLIILKLSYEHEYNGKWNSYRYLDLHMTELLDLANQSRKIQEMKAFW